jgi:radical SAM superfamily enzyme YgiQ (UPF0313 family)
MNELKNQSKSVLLISCYELGHQPAGIAMPMAFLRDAGFDVEAMDVSVQGFDREKVTRARFIGVSVPMHTALRLGLRIAEQVRGINPSCHICFFGLYASLNAEYLLDTVADSIIGGEFEESLVALIRSLDAGEQVSINGVNTKDEPATPVLARLDFPIPDRSALPPLEHYARLEHKGEEVLVGYVEASRGCLHHCTHCPIPPVYDGRFFVVKKEVVLEDIRRLASAGARHVTFGDPDFLNGPTHSLNICRAMHEEFPDLTFDFTAKIEHVLKYRTLIAEFAGLGCIFVVCAVESLSDSVLGHLEKGHTRADVREALDILRDAGITLRPSFVSFTPWTTVDDFIDVLEFVEAHNLIDHVDPVQYSIRLLVPPGSVLLARPESRTWLGRLAQESFTYEWSHEDPRMDELHKQVSALVEQAVRRNEDSAVTFYRILELAYAMRGDREPVRGMPGVAPIRLRPPRLTEAWFC